MLDGTLVRTHRIRAYDRRYYASKPHHHGVNLQELTDLHGRLIWIFDGLSGSTHDLSATHTHGVFTVADQAELHLYADKGYVDGAGATLLTPGPGAKPAGLRPGRQPLPRRCAPTANAASRSSRAGRCSTGSAATHAKSVRPPEPPSP